MTIGTAQPDIKLGRNVNARIDDRGVFLYQRTGCLEIVLDWQEANLLAGILAGYLEDQRRQEEEHEAEAFPPDPDISW